jgi:hypothetical protein
MNLASWIAGLVVLAIAALIVRNMIIEKRNGKCSCGCSSCSGTCPHCITPVKEMGDSNETE